MGWHVPRAIAPKETPLLDEYLSMNVEDDLQKDLLAISSGARPLVQAFEEATLLTSCEEDSLGQLPQ